MIEETLRQWNKSDVSVEEILAIKNLFFREMKENICVMPGAIEFLRSANPRYRIALATSATPAFRAAGLAKLGVDAEVFEVVVDRKDSSSKKVPSTSAPRMSCRALPR
jgi:beta-phosphoglucomutase-like phosphatase (HAD superfamily)